MATLEDREIRTLKNEIEWWLRQYGETLKGVEHVMANPELKGMAKGLLKDAKEIKGKINGMGIVFHLLGVENDIITLRQFNNYRLLNSALEDLEIDVG